MIDGEFVPFPTQDELEESDLDLIVSGSKDAVLMIEGFAREMPEDRMARGDCARPIGIVRRSATCRRSWSPRSSVEKKQYDVPPPTTACSTGSRTTTTTRFSTAKQTDGKQARAEAVADLKAQAMAELIPDPTAEGAVTPHAFAHGLARAWKSRSCAI